MGNKKMKMPAWDNRAPKPGTFRSIFKWGDPNEFKHPSEQLFDLIREQFELPESHFEKSTNQGFDKVKLPDHPSLLDKKHVEAIKKIVGEENISLSDYDRLNYSTGYAMEEIMELRQGEIHEISDLIVHPRHKEDVRALVRYCDDKKIPIYVFGGGSSVNFGLRPTKGGITLVLGTHMNKILELNETDKTCTVQAGMLGPAYESGLNNAKELFGTQRNYCCGHYPQSFEYSSVGGWIVTLGAGQQSSYFGDMYDIVLGMEFVTPVGDIKTHNFRAAATGPKVNDILKGSEGTFGICVEVTCKIFYHQPENYVPMGFMFKTFEDGIAAAREISQGEFGFPGVMRISDGEETSMGLKLYGIEGTWMGTAIDLFGYKSGERSLFLMQAEGEKGFARNVAKNIRKICRKHGAMYLTGYPIKKWEHGRYRDPYLREDLGDYGLIIDTFETSVSWSNLHNLHLKLREYIKRRPHTMAMSHASHFYSEGTNLYIIFFTHMDELEEYRSFQKGIFETIVNNGGSLSHHHGVGRMIAPWMEEYLGKEQLDVLKTLKRHFDPHNIMNPGGQMGVDYNASDLEDHEWRIDWKKM